MEFYKQNLSRYYGFDSADILCEQFNKFVKTLKKEKEDINEKYPWLEKDDKRKNMSDREILDRYRYLDKILSIRLRKEAGYGYVI